MEVRKPKYGSEKKSRLSMFSAFLTHECVCWGLVDKRELNLCDVRAGSSALELQRVSLSQIVQCACDSQTQTKTNGECMGQSCGLYAPGMSWQWCRCECCHSSSPMAQPATKTLANTSRNETKTRLHTLCHPKHARWSPMYQYLGLTSLRGSHPLPTRHICEPGTDRQLFFLLPYFRFRTSVSIIRFRLSIFHLSLYM